MDDLAERNDDIAQLREKAAQGGLEDKAALGRHLLTVPPFSWDEGLTLTVEAAKAGHGGAEHLVAVISGAGIIGAPDWAGALSHLQRSAELGYAPAKRELAFLARNSSLAPQAAKKNPPPDLWWRLRQSINLHALLAVPSARPLSESPRIFVAEGFASPHICDWLVARAKPLLTPARVFDPSTGSGINDGDRDNRLANLALGEADLVLLSLRARIGLLSGLSPKGMEATAILNYMPGERFLPHFDFLDAEVPGHLPALQAGGQRVLTFLMYLNDAYEGGETDFPAAGHRFKGKKGDALFFWNVDPMGAPDRLTLHAGLPPTKGEKWLFSQWVRALA